MVDVGTWSLPVKVHQEKNRNQKQISTVFDRAIKFPIDHRRVFFDCGFFLVHFYWQTPVSEFYQGYSSRSSTTVNLVQL
jgi:hypothetical protein